MLDHEIARVAHDANRAYSITLGVMLTNGRKAKGISLRNAAKMAGMSNGYLCLIETGKQTNVAPKYLHALAVIYQLDYLTLMEAAGHPVPMTVGYPATPDTPTSGDIGRRFVSRTDLTPEAPDANA